MKKKLTAMFLAVVMVLSSTAIPASATNQRFTDVPDTHWAYSYIQSAAADGVMNGTGEGLFSPSKTLTRAEFIVMMMRAFYSEEVASREAELKSDSMETTWYTAHCFLAYEKGLLASASMEAAIRDSIGKLKNPDSKLYGQAKSLSETSAETITRIDMAVLAYHIMMDKSVPELTSEQRLAAEASIPDAGEVNRHQTLMMDTAYYYGVLTGIDSAGTFNPEGSVDRASAAAIYCRLRDCIKKYAGTENPVVTPAPTPTPTPTPSVEPTPAPITDSKKAPYATTESSLVGTISDSEVTLSLSTHKPVVDYWSNTSPEVQALVDKDAYNAIVFTMLNREWMVENEIVQSNRRYPTNFNFACFEDSPSSDSTRAITPAIYAMQLGGYGYSNGQDIYHPNTESNNVGFYVTHYSPLETHTNGAFVPIFAKFTPGMSDKDKIVIMVEALCEKMTYNDGSAEVANIPGAMSSGYWASSEPLLKGICDDYANMFLSICRVAGIPCMVIGNSTHAWNLVYADQEWLMVDPTATDTGGFAPYYTPEEYTKATYRIPTDDFRVTQLIIEALYEDVYGNK